MIDNQLKVCSKTSKNLDIERTLSSSSNQGSSRKRIWKGENPIEFRRETDLSLGHGYSNSWNCKNSACRAVLSGNDTFCQKCSCCICYRFDDNKDPSLWLVCGSEDPHDSCGLTCHIECAFKHGKVGVINLEQITQSDGSYCCASCGKLSGILGFLKMQLIIAKDARRVDVLCHRLYLSYRLLNGAPRYKELLDIVQSAKIKLESDVGPLDDVSSKMRQGIVSRLPVGSDVQKLCADAIEKVNVWLTNSSKTVNIPPGSADKNGLIPDLNEGLVPSSERSRDEGIGRTSAQAVGANSDVPSCGTHSKGRPKVSWDEGSGSSSKKPRGLDEEFEDSMKIIQRLRREGHIDTDFVTWFRSRSTERERYIVHTFIQNFMDDLKGLAGQLVDTFSEIVSSKRSRN